MDKIKFILVFLVLVEQSLSLPADICDGTEIVEVLPHPDDCTLYILCVNRVPTIINCPENEFFNPDTKVCEPGFPEFCESTTSATATTSSISIESTTTEYPTTTEDPKVTTTEVSIETTTESGLPDDFCVGISSGFLPHPFNCFQFVFCMNQSPIITSCPLETPVFLNGTCVAGDPVTCEIFTTTTEAITEPLTTTESITITEPVTTTAEKTTTTEDVTTNEPATTTPISVDYCAEVGTGFLPYPGDCTRFVLCMAGSAIVNSCPGQTIFYIASCVPGDPTTCEVFTPTTELSTTTMEPITTITETSDTTTEPFITTTESFITTKEPLSTPTTEITSITEPEPEITTLPATSTRSTTTQRPIGPPELCIGNNFRFIPDPDYCFRYYYCLFGIALPGTCEPDKIFSKKWNGCVIGDWETCEATNLIFS